MANWFHKILFVIGATVCLAACNNLAVFLQSTESSYKGKYSATINQSGFLTFILQDVPYETKQSFEIYLTRKDATQDYLNLASNDASSLVKFSLTTSGNDAPFKAPSFVDTFTGNTYTLKQKVDPNLYYSVQIVQSRSPEKSSAPIMTLRAQFAPLTQQSSARVIDGEVVLNLESVNGANLYEVYADAGLTKLIATSETNSVNFREISPFYWIKVSRGDFSSHEVIKAPLLVSKTNLLSIKSSSLDGIYSLGKKLVFKLTYSAKIKVTRDAKLILALDSGLAEASYVSGTGTDEINFVYTVRNGDDSTELRLSSETLPVVLDNQSFLVANGIEEAIDEFNAVRKIEIDTTAPTNPSSVGAAQAASTDGTLHVSWSSGADRNLSRHNIKLCSDRSCSKDCIDEGYATVSNKHLSAVPDGLYYSCVQAEDKSGQVSAWISGLNTSLFDSVAPVFNAGPDVITNHPMTLSAQTNEVLTFTWSKVSGPGTLNFSSATGKETVVDATAEGSYLIRLTATDIAGNSSSDDLSFGWDTTAPVFAGLENLSLKADTSELFLVWPLATDALSPDGKIVFDVCQSSIPGSCASNFITTYTSPAANWDYHVTGLSPGVVYEFVVRARDEAGNRDSNTVAKQNNLFSDAIQISVGGSHACALRTDGTVWCWGNNSQMQVGQIAPFTIAAPTQVPGLSNVTSISTGGEFSCALLTNKTVQCWGYNFYNQLGDGTGAKSSSPVTVVGLSDVSILKSGGENSCAVLTDKSLKCWGNGYFDVLGAGTANATGLKTLTAPTNVDTVELGQYYSCAILSDKTVSCWGYVVVGDVSYGSSSTPSPISSISNAVSIATTGATACALSNDGSVKCWGSNSNGNLGDGSAVASSALPVSVTGINNAVKISAGYRHFCAQLGDGNVKCWGDNMVFQLGITGPSSSNIPLQVINLSQITSIDSGGNLNCAITAATLVRCWGDSRYAPLSSREQLSRSAPTRATDLNAFESIYVGMRQSCGTLSGGSVKCWGAVGDYLFPTPTLMPGLTGVHSIGLDNSSACFVIDTGVIKCIGGFALDIQIASALPLKASTLMNVPNISTALKVSVNGSTACALLGDKTVSCWGSNDKGQLGRGTPSAYEAWAAPVQGLSGAVDIMLGGSGGYACALIDDGTIKCWGSGTHGSLGNGLGTDSAVPVSVAGIGNAQSLAGEKGLYSVCALLTNKSVKCWGYNVVGSLGNNDMTLTIASTPVAVVGITDAEEIQSGVYSYCVRTAGKKLKCWGLDLTDPYSYTPVPLAKELRGVGLIDKFSLEGGNTLCAKANAGSWSCIGSIDGNTLLEVFPSSQFIPIAFP